MYQAVCEALLRLGWAKGTHRPAEDLIALPSEVAGRLNELVHGKCFAQSRNRVFVLVSFCYDKAVWQTRPQTSRAPTKLFLSHMSNGQLGQNWDAPCVFSFGAQGEGSAPIWACCSLGEHKPCLKVTAPSLLPTFHWPNQSTWSSPISMGWGNTLSSLTTEARINICWMTVQNIYLIKGF